MKKIGILTFHSTDNYGGVLQCFALQEYIKMIVSESDVDIINYILPGSRLVISAKDDVSTIEVKRQRANRFNSFREQYLDLSSEVTKDDFAMMDYDVCVVGSDQVFNPHVIRNSRDVFFLRTIDRRVKKISYAASTGFEKISHDYVQWYIDNLSDFDYISVREQCSADELSHILNRKVNTCLDPTLLFYSEYWEKYERKPQGVGNKPYVFMYGLGYPWCKESEKQACMMAQQIADERHLEIVHNYYGEYRERFRAKAESSYNCGPQEFLWLVHHAEYVVCCSFHGTVFSAIYRKPFFSFSTGGNGVRIKELLNIMGLSYRYTDVIPDHELWYESIDWNAVDVRIDIKRMESVDFLKEALD